MSSRFHSDSDELHAFSVARAPAGRPSLPSRPGPVRAALSSTFLNLLVLPALAHRFSKRIAAAVPGDENRRRVLQRGWGPLAAAAPWIS